ncbi:MAG: hypothetical protein ACXVX6_02295 [Mycobacterium sp.]
MTDFAQRTIDLARRNVADAADVYRFWNERNGGQRRSTVVAPA